MKEKTYDELQRRKVENDLKAYGQAWVRWTLTKEGMPTAEHIDLARIKLDDVS